MTHKWKLAQSFLCFWFFGLDVRFSTAGSRKIKSCPQTPFVESTILRVMNPCQRSFNYEANAAIDGDKTSTCAIRERIAGNRLLPAVGNTHCDSVSSNVAE